LPKFTSYDYIIAGAGCAGLSLAVHMIKSGKFSEKKILLIDKDDKKRNDRTWCFWEKKTGLFDSLVYKKWNNAWFYGEDFSSLLDLSPYEYKLIKGIDFYEYSLHLIKQQSNFEIVNSIVEEIKSQEGQSWIIADGNKITATYIFSSIVFEKPVLKEKEHYLLQHFRGWIIETEKPSFNPKQATLMDFRVSQQYGTTFVYVMPFSETQALVEYTLFTESLLDKQQYEDGLQCYIKDILKIDSYKIIEEEFGIIPMTNHSFPLVNGGIINIGTAGGQTKASSGYTFNFIQKHSARMVQNLIKRNNPFIPLPGGPGRFKFYDSVLLHILKHRQLAGDKIFTQLFKKNKPRQVLRFLDNESSLLTELKIISSLPTWPFLKAALRQL
jgi:lycopene beta-cyclase